MLARPAVAIFLTLMLGGCAVVTSDRPLFSAAERAGAPVLKPGLWAMPNADCRYDEQAQAATWPECANPSVVTAATIAGGERDASGRTSQVLAYVLARGDPPVVQVAAPPSEPKGPKFVYAGLRPTAFDGDRRVTAARIWLALCARPPRAKDATLTPPPETLPPGLVKRPGDPSCVAAAADPVRKAVVRSEGWIAAGGADDLSLSAHWVRDGDR
jgi:hypothetical protein